MTSHKTIMHVVLLLLICSICGCKSPGPKAVIGNDAGLIKTSLQLQQVEEGVRAFIKEKGWTHSNEIVDSWRHRLIATTPKNGTISFECIRITLEFLQEPGEATVVTISVPGNEFEYKQEVSNELAKSLWERFYRQ